MPRKMGITDELIIKMYIDGVSYKEMSDKTGLSARAILNVITKNGLKATRTGPPRKHKVNEAFFDQWTNEMAWVLGLIVTDGNIPTDNYSALSISQKDEATLKLIAKYMGADYIITALYKTRKTPTLLINSAKLRKRLFELGITNKKSLVIPFPKVPEEFLPAFIRGVIDGDGWVQDRGYVMNVTTGSNDFANGLVTTFRSWQLNSEITTQLSGTGKFIYRVWVKGKYDIIKLAKILYNDCTDGIITKKRQRMTQRF